MIKAEVALADLSFEPVWREGSLWLGTSRMTPYAHPMLETVLVRAPGRWFMVVRERQADSGGHANVHGPIVDARDEATYHAIHQACLLWPLDYVMVEVAQAGRRVRVRAGMLGTAPVYCAVGDDRVTLSWDSADFARYPALLDTEVASHQLALRTTYAARQLYAGVVLLTERASLHVEPGRARYRYPEAMEEGGPPAEDGEDRLPGFSEALQRAVSLRPWPDGAASLELSGGMDSATVAVALAQRHRDIDSKGILLDGEVRAPQAHRRQRIAERLGLADHTVDITAFPPGLDLALPAEPYGFCREFYLEACSALWASARDNGRHTLFTGVGGDELFPAYLNEVSEETARGPLWGRDARSYAEALLTPTALAAAHGRPLFDAPLSPVPVTSLLANACRAPDLLKHGQWPVHPLSDPRLAYFCHRLPRSSREGREVMRRYLESHLGGDVFPKGYLKETFANVLPPLLARHAGRLAAQLGECALADLGLVKREAVLALLQTIAETHSHPAASAFASFLWLERVARQASA
ncbi:asparagine synthase C-terminal domain-containing protein [Luteibacter aegosomatissinici]|uniref:asparagine synthase-related protein n=1 Tax=Luteibacter aegosomatissinici TaxID=2911539 RepID=UPI001FF9782D|nr:asparagine synthase C-terminal domain-containing protein [Luteibacter aegosomatissinici]UPG93001.1 asparagine synthase C-terminal domain-containing protein [Luteibacter aegosomatissinici]